MGESFTDGSRAPHIVGKSTEWMKCLPPKLEYFGRIREDNMKKYDELASQAADSGTCQGDEPAFGAVWGSGAGLHDDRPIRPELNVPEGVFTRAAHSHWNTLIE